MTYDPQSPDANPVDPDPDPDKLPLEADLADDEDVPEPDLGEVPLEANEVDVAEQRIEVSGWVDDDAEDT
jgi:hypothetical protein